MGDMYWYLSWLGISFVTACVSLRVAGSVGEVPALEATLTRRDDIKVSVGKWTWTESSPWPPIADIRSARIWKDECYAGLRERLQRQLPVPVLEENAEFVTIQQGNLLEVPGESLAERGERIKKQAAEGGLRDGIVHILPMEVGDALPKSIGQLAVKMVIVEVPGDGHGLEGGLHNFAISKIAAGAPAVLAGPRRWTDTVVAQVQKDLAEEGLRQYPVQLFHPSKACPPYAYTWDEMVILSKNPLNFVV